MKKISIIFSVIVVLFTSCSSKQEGPDDSIIKMKCIENNFTVNEISFIDTISGDSIKNVINLYKKTIQDAIIFVGDSALFDYLCPNGTGECSALNYYLGWCDYKYLKYEVVGYPFHYEDQIEKRYLLVPIEISQKKLNSFLC